MRAAIPLLAFAAFVALGGCHKVTPKPAAQVAIPVAARGQAPGLWVERVEDRAGAHETRYCLDASASAGLAAFDHQLSDKCVRHDMAQDAGGAWHFATRCDMGAAGTIETKGVMKGDFASHYVVEMETQTMGAAKAAANGPGRVRAEFQRAGDCPKTMRPGDIVSSGSGPTRLDQLSART